MPPSVEKLLVFLAGWSDAEWADLDGWLVGADARVEMAKRALRVHAAATVLTAVADVPGFRPVMPKPVTVAAPPPPPPQPRPAAVKLAGVMLAMNRPATVGELAGELSVSPERIRQLLGHDWFERVIDDRPARKGWVKVPFVYGLTDAGRAAVVGAVGI